MAFPAELGLILLFSILGGVFAVRFRQPSVLGLILIGAIVGPNNLGFIKDTSLINASIEIGAILLLFTVGIEFSLQHLLNLGLRSVLIAIIKLGIVFLFSYYTSLLLGFGLLTSLYIGVILSITSTVIVIKILDQKGMSKREELPLLVTILIIEDIFAVFALTFFSSLNTRIDLTPLNIFIKLAVSITILAVAYVILQKILKPMIKWLVKYSTEDTITFISLGLCGGMSYLALLLNLSPSVGAFLAGNIVASLPNSRIFEKAINPFILAFTSLFFFSIGTIVDFSVILNSIHVVIALFIINIATKFMAIGFGSYVLTNFNGRQAVFSGIAMLSVGEFSLLIAKEYGTLGLGMDLVSITSAVIFLSSIAMSILLNCNERIYNAITSLLPVRVREDMGLASKYLSGVSFSIIRDRVNVKKILMEWKSLLNSLFLIFSIFAIIFFAWRYFNDLFLSFFRNQFIAYFAAILFFVVIFFPALNIFKNTSGLLKDFLNFFIKLYPKEISNEKKIFKNLSLLAILFILLLIFPSALLFFKFDPIYNIFALIFIIAILIDISRASSLIHAITKKHERAFNKLSKKYKLLMKKRMKMRGTENE
ncbi:cation:proton antiporter [Candidatus Woesearchaeota archaeon]|nr:cation:proton antiporter [Candidatus Woesearchaeota archaeon]